MPVEIAPALIQQFNLAAMLGRDGEHASSLAAYRSLLEKIAAGAEATDEFRATAHMRMGFCLMDLGRFDDAKKEFEAMKPLLDSLSTEGQYELYFAYGNTLGNLGELKQMFSELIMAVSRAEDMDDYTSRPAACWTNILNHALKAKAWKFLDEKAEIAMNNAKLRGMPGLQIYAAEMIGHARRGMKASRARAS